MKKNILTVSLVVLFLIGVLTSGCIGKEESSIGEQQTSAVVSGWKSAKSEGDLVRVVNFLLNNKGKEIELNGKHIITGKEKLNIKIKMLGCCTKPEFEDVMELISKKGEVKSSNFNKREFHASVPADEIQEIDDIWNVERIDFEPEARNFWMEVVG